MVKKITKIIGIGIAIALLCGILFLLSIRHQFVKHLEISYPDKHFSVGLTQIDVLYKKYYTKVKCKENDVEFFTSRYYSSSKIDDNYQDMWKKNENQLTVDVLFKDKVVEPFIGSAFLSPSDSGTYDYLYIGLSIDCDPLAAIEEIQKVVQASDLHITTLQFNYGDKEHEYEVEFPTAKILTQEELEAKVVQKK